MCVEMWSTGIRTVAGSDLMRRHTSRPLDVRQLDVKDDKVWAGGDQPESIGSWMRLPGTSKPARRSIFAIVYRLA